MGNLWVFRKDDNRPPSRALLLTVKRAFLTLPMQNPSNHWNTGCLVSRLPLLMHAC